MFWPTGIAGIRLNSWNTIAMPRLRDSPGPRTDQRDAVDLDLAGVAGVRPVDDLDERRLAGAVLADEPVDLAAAEA